MKEAPGSEGKPEPPAAGTVPVTAPQAQGETPASSSAVPQTPPIASATEDEDESEDESEVLEESPCGRWQKRRDQVSWSDMGFWCRITSEPFMSLDFFSIQQNMFRL